MLSKPGRLRPRPRPKGQRPILRPRPAASRRRPRPRPAGSIPRPRPVKTSLKSRNSQ